LVDNLTAANANNTLTIGDGNATGTNFAGVIKNTTGSLALIKTGSGVQTLSGANEYSGTTTVSTGTLLVNGDQSLATGAVQVDGTLGGSGIVGGAVTVSSGGTIAPGTDGTIESLDIAGNTSIAGTFACDVDAAATDELFVTGNLTLSGSTLAINEINPGTPGTYVIANYTGSRTGTLGGSLPSGYSVNYDDTNKKVELVIAGSDYDDWMDLYPSITLEADKLPTADPDKDGLTNEVEYAFGLAPNSGSSISPILTQLDKTTGIFTYQRRATTGLTYTVLSSTDLATWGPASASESPGTPDGNGVQTVTVTFTSVPLTADKLFVRVKAE
jgi:autotransporter-associated beta strand protein